MRSLPRADERFRSALVTGALRSELAPHGVNVTGRGRPRLGVMLE
jgi:hypothetical protein